MGQEQFVDRHAVVTGGSRGIGYATAQALAARGARVSLIARDADTLASAAADLRATGARVATASADVADPSSIEQAMAAVTGEFGHCDILVTSAGMSRPGRFLDLTDDIHRRLMEVNYFGTLHAVRAVAPGMVERGTGSIVGISSAAGLLGVYGFTGYAASKFAVRGLFESLRQELAPHGVHVACVYPGDVDTDMLREEAAFKPEETAALSATINAIPPEQVAAAVVRAIDRGRSHVTCDRSTSLVEKAVVLARRPVNTYIDWRIRRTGRSPGASPS